MNIDDTDFDNDMYPFYAIVTFGSPGVGTWKPVYTSLAEAIRDLRTLRGGSMTSARVVGCKSRSEAVEADISGNYPVLAQL